MRALKANGRVIAFWENNGRYRPNKPRLAYDDKNSLESVDSIFARKILSALATSLDSSEMGKILTILTDADLITTEEARDVSDAMGEADTPTPEAAMDAMFPHANRLKQGGGLGFDAASSARARHHVPTQAENASYRQMFPDAGRLK